MDYNFIRNMIAAAENAKSALEWLTDDRYNTEGPDFRVPKYDMNGIATAVHGADQARRYLNSAMLAHLPEIMQTARSMCAEHMQAAETAICETVSDTVRK